MIVIVFGCCLVVVFSFGRSFFTAKYMVTSVLLHNKIQIYIGQYLIVILFLYEMVIMSTLLLPLVHKDSEYDCMFVVYPTSIYEILVQFAATLHQKHVLP